MNDRYLFRGKRKSDGKWLYGLYSDDYVHETDFPCIMPLRSKRNDNDWAVIRKTVGQYIGFTDKNGKKIFEDDIVYDEQSGYNYYIKWFPEYACFALANKNGHIEFGCDELEIFLDDLVVIGNIHDNPELLKGE